MTKKEKKLSEWKPMFWRKADRIGVCDGCNNDINIGDIIFYFPTIKKFLDSHKGTVYCCKCISSKLDAITIAETL